MNAWQLRVIVCGAALIAGLASQPAFADRLFWTYQYAGAASFDSSSRQTALAMADGKTWPMVFVQTNPWVIQPYALNPFRNPATDTYWSPMGPGLTTPSVFRDGSPRVLSAISSANGEVGVSARPALAVSSLASEYLAYVGRRQTGLTNVTMGAADVVVTPAGEVIPLTLDKISGSGVTSLAAIAGAAVTPWNGVGLIATPNTYLENSPAMGWGSATMPEIYQSPGGFADLAYDSFGRPVVAYSSWGSVYASSFDIMSGQWKQSLLGTASPSNVVFPTVTSDSKGGVGIAWVSTVGSASTLMYSYKAGHDPWNLHVVTSSVTVPLTIGGEPTTDFVAPQTRVGLDFDADDLPVISFIGQSQRVYIAYDPVLPADTIPDDIRYVAAGQELVDVSPVTGDVRFVKQGEGLLVRDAPADQRFGALVEAGTLAVNVADGLGSGTLDILGGAAVIANVPTLNTSLISLGTDAVLDVSSRPGDFTVKAGQTIAGSGTILGSVTFGSGATLSPGLPPSAWLAGPGEASSGFNVSSSDWGSGALSHENGDVDFHLASPVPVPEPSTWVMGAVGIACAGSGAWSRRKRA
jgi:hypothetical protein